MRYRIRMVEFVGEQHYPQGSGLTWDDVVIDVPDDEQIVEVKALSPPASAMGLVDRVFNAHVAVVRVWLMKQVDDDVPLRCDKCGNPPLGSAQVVGDPCQYDTCFGFLKAMAS